MPNDALQDLDITTIANEVASQESMTEANAPRTFPTGFYNLRRKDMKAQQAPDGRQFLHYTVDVLDPATGDRRGTGFFDASWNEYRTAAGKLTKPSAIFRQIAATLGVKPSVGDVDGAFQNALVGGFFTQTLQSPEGMTDDKGKRLYIDVGDKDVTRDGRTVKITQSGANELIASGLRANNYLQSVSKAKV